MLSNLGFTAVAGLHGLCSPLQVIDVPINKPIASMEEMTLILGKGTFADACMKITWVLSGMCQNAESPEANIADCKEEYQPPTKNGHDLACKRHGT